MCVAIYASVDSSTLKWRLRLGLRIDQGSRTFPVKLSGRQAGKCKSYINVCKLIKNHKLRLVHSVEEKLSKGGDGDGWQGKAREKFTLESKKTEKPLKSLLEGNSSAIKVEINLRCS